MKINKFKSISAAVCFAVNALWSEAQSMDNDNIKQNIEDFKRTQIALIDEQFAMARMENERCLAHPGIGSGTYAAEARAALAREHDLARQQVNIKAELYGEQLAYLKLRREREAELINSKLIICFKAADEGDVNAQTFLGNMYRDEELVQSDLKAVVWYRKAANQGFSNAQANLGSMYKNGRGVVQSDVEAAHWYRKAAEQGLASAQFNLGLFYYLGEGVNKNDIEAAHWCRKAADQGDSIAQFYLGNMYKHGFGVKQSKLEAEAWFRKSAKQGNSNAQLTLNQLK